MAALSAAVSHGARRVQGSFMSLNRTPCAWFAISLAAMLSGCLWATTKREGKDLRRDVAALEHRVAAKERDLDTQVTALQRVIDAATDTLRRNAANLGADFQTIEADLRAMRGRVTSLQAALEKDRVDNAARVATLEARLLAIEQAKVRPSSPQELWDLGRAAFGASRWREARDLFGRLVAEFPGHDRADDAQYFSGETLLRESSWEAAIREYRKVVDRYPDSSLGDDALFRAAHAAEQLKQCSEARAYLGLLRQRYERSELAKQAVLKDKALRASSRSKAKCRS
jgi:TolA-binding protein